MRIPTHNLQSGVERLTTGNQPEQQPRGLTAGQNPNQPGVIPGAVLHHLPPVPVSVLHDLTQLADSVLQSPPPVPARRSSLCNPIVRRRSFVCAASDSPEKCVNMSSPERYVSKDFSLPSKSMASKKVRQLRTGLNLCFRG